MSRLDDLIQEYCPDGVEYKPLKSFMTQYNGMTGVSGKWADSGNCQFIDYMNAYTNMKIDASQLKNATVKKLSQNTIKQGDILCTSASEVPEECAISSVVENAIDDNIFLDDHLFGLRINEEYRTIVDPVFLNYYFHTSECRNKINKTVRGVTRFYISTSDFMKITVPLPPLPVQKEIVRILDTFTELTTELSAELAARKKQYETYREILLEPYKDYPKKKLKDVADINRGIRVVKKQLLENGTYPVYQNSLLPMGYYEKSNCSANTTYVISAGAAGEIGYCNCDFWAADDCLVFTNLKDLENKYIYHFLMINQDYIQAKVRKASIPRLSRIVIENLEIPMIPLNEQNRIIDILDRFDTLCNDISTGLPAEIEARQKQYEYYRDKLLTFKELKN